MNILRAYKRTRFFLWINIAGLAIGLASAIMLILFVTNELSYDKHIKDSERIISLNTVMERNGNVSEIPIATRKALVEIPLKVPGIEAATQIYKIGAIDFKYNNEDYIDVPALMTESGFCDVFGLEFIEGNKDVLNVPLSLVITEKYANLLFGSAAAAIHKTIDMGDETHTIGGIVKDLPLNTHFRFEILSAMDNNTKSYPSIEFFTFYKLKEGVSIEDTRASIEKEYTVMVSEFLQGFGGSAVGKTEKLTDLYLKTQATSTLGKKSSMSFIWMLSIIAAFILLLAITNFVNLFIAQGETRILEIGVRKTNGATRKDISKKFFSEILTVVFIAFAIGFILLIICTPHFAKIINRDIDLTQLYNPVFIIATILLFSLTVFLSASYPTIYLTKFNTLDILAKRIHFSKRKLTGISITFQAIITIIIISFILVVNNQTDYLRKQPLGYNPKNVLIMGMSKEIWQGYNSLKQELEKKPGIKQVSMAHHTFGGGPSGQGISLPGESTQKSISEYRIHTGICELMELQLVEGTFYREDDPTNEKTVILNEAAIKDLNLTYPVVGTTVDYKGQKEIRAVVKDFYYDELENPITPIVLRYIGGGGNVYIKYDDNMSRNEVEQTIRDVLSNFDSTYILNPTWLEDVYTSKFDILDVQSRILIIASILSIFISAIGLLAMHMLSTMRRKKEVGIRRVNGASSESIFALLSVDILKWILIAGIIAIPVVYYFASEWLSNYANRASLNWSVFILPVLLQFIITIIVTSGVTIKTLSQNPADVLKTE
ncbi:hypothetical protein D0T84_03045 [Dysgonomonas sp. 521]|uniref:ABC transporter permease n=1 Tax=Dysgonomonas sp. 521 TaxID=2302932 RepID=UPI0013D1523D|nr:FtsX-like permease family protein [Dysgonomonas sp. 521]NDV93895.1 hypothetical protein [Dysgonomonas sp. 521]